MSTVQTVCPPFMDSQTHRNLQSACMGEQQAQRLYLHAARCMEEAHLYVIAHALRFTAAQEKEHADVFRGLLTAYGGQEPPQAADAPILLPGDPMELLRGALQSEREAGNALYPGSARTAEAEGYPRIAGAFRRIAETEQLHARRFLQYQTLLAEGRLFRDDARVSWFCLICGQLYTGDEAPAVCSGCGRDRGHLIRSSFFPFWVKEE